MDDSDSEFDRTDLRARIDSAVMTIGGDSDASHTADVGLLRLDELTVDDEW